MEVPLRLAFKNLDPSEAVTAHIRKMVNHLHKFYNRIISCDVVIEIPHRRHQKGNLYQVRIDVKIPGEEFVVKQHHRLAAAHRDIYVAIHEAFDTAKRALDESKQIRRGQIKTSPSNYSYGHVVRLLETLDDAGDYGFLKTEDGREIYFHRNTVLGNHYDQLEVGTGVRFSEEQGELGPQASTVTIIGRNRKAS